jgi:hypothetical protein
VAVRLRMQDRPRHADDRAGQAPDDDETNSEP